jgi:hypothetical protein
MPKGFNSPPVAVTLVDQRSGLLARPSSRRGQGAFVASLLVWLASFALVVIPSGTAGHSPVKLVAWSFAAAATVLAGLARRVPWQNAIPSALVIVVVDGGLEGDLFSGRLDDVARCAARSAVLMTAREIARWALRSWRGAGVYGIGVISLAAIMAVFWAVASEEANHAFAAMPTLACLLRFALALFASAPWMIEKHPVERPADRRFLPVWAMLAAFPVIRHPRDASSIALELVSLAAIGMAVRSMGRK